MKYHFVMVRQDNGTRSGVRLEDEIFQIIKQVSGCSVSKYVNNIDGIKEAKSKASFVRIHLINELFAAFEKNRGRELIEKLTAEIETLKKEQNL